MLKRTLNPVLVSIGLAFLLAAALWFSYEVGHRAGRGQACFEAAIRTPDERGRTLTGLFLSREGATSDYTFWGTYCTVTVGYYDEEGEWVGGRWRFIPDQMSLYADEGNAAVLFPASGSWNPVVGR
jgi:hypothetical protein